MILKSDIDSINRLFLEDLINKNFPLYEQQLCNGTLYKGKLVFQNQEISFIISVTDESGQVIVQIVFHDMIKDINQKSELEWLDFLNNWNDASGAGYYLALSKRKRLYLRNIFMIDALSVKEIYKNFLVGVNLLHQIIIENS